MVGVDGWSDKGIAAGTAVLGLGGCLDYEITWDSAVVEALAREHAIAAKDLDYGGLIHTERELVASILAFARDGLGGERAVASVDILDAISARFPRRITLGGTSVRAAIGMSRIGVPSTLHLVSVDDHVRRLLPPDVAWICSGDEDSLNPHLIVQFPRGARVALEDGFVDVHQANRLIYVCDPANTRMALHPTLGTLLAGARVFLISGLNAMDDVALLRARLAELTQAMDSLHDDALVVFEDAGYHLAEFSEIVIDQLVDRIDVYGMNEDELQSRVGRTVDLLDPADIKDALEAVSARIPVPTLVVHTSRWALAYGRDARRFAAALDGGIDLAGARYLAGDDLDAARYSAVRALPRQRDGNDVADGLQALLGDWVCCRAARVVETQTPTMVGLGDAFVGGVIAALTRASIAGSGAQ
jgi:ADP-dependent phosphofructokinase/glucokinase